MARQKATKVIELTFDYSHGVILRRSGVTAKDWEYLVHKFGVLDYAPEEVTSIVIEGADDFGRLMVSINVEV